MLKNYIKIAWRNLLKNKVYSFINIFGLALGMAVAILIGLWMWDEISFDKYHKNYDTIGQVRDTQIFDGHVGTNDALPMPTANAMRTKYKGDFKYIALSSWLSNMVLKTGNQIIQGKGFWVEPDYPQIFGLDMVQGNTRALQDPSSALIAQSLAKSLFGSTNPMGKSLKVNNKADVKIAGVFKDLPGNTTIGEAKILLTFEKYRATEEWVRNSADAWGNHAFQLFVQVQDHANLDRVSSKIRDIVKPNFKEGNDELLIHPMSKWHLYSEFTNGKVTGGRIRYVWLFGVIGIFVLLLACINFMNLSTARSEKRAKEVGVRKAMGSMRVQLIAQFLSESLVMAGLAFVLSVVIVLLFLPLFNSISGKQLTMPWGNSIFWMLALCFTLFTGLISGSYPALYLSAFNPVKVLKGTFKAGRFAALPRKVLVVIQFTVSVTLIIGTIIVFKQIRYAQNRPVGYTRERLIDLRMNTPEIYGHYDAVRQQLLNTGVIENVAESSGSPTNLSSSQIGYDWKGKDPNSMPVFGTIAVTHDYGKTLGWQVVAGRDFSREYKTDTAGLVINESAAKMIGFKNPIGQVIRFNGRPLTIVGVVKDILMESPYLPVMPSVFLIDYEWSNSIIIRLKPNVSAHEALDKIEKVYKTISPDGFFSYSFIDDAFAQKFIVEERVGKLATFFAVLAILISSLGLFGLASFVAEQRTKEIGVRKVLGASVYNLWTMLSKDFVTLVIISCAIAVPLAWYYLNSWLQEYDYRTSISWWIFAASAFGALFITLLTVSFQAIKAAIANPVKSLRTE